jgi:hypothetical protein
MFDKFSSGFQEAVCTVVEMAHVSVLFFTLCVTDIGTRSPEVTPHTVYIEEVDPLYELVWNGLSDDVKRYKTRAQLLPDDFIRTLVEDSVLKARVDELATRFDFAAEHEANKDPCRYKIDKYSFLGTGYFEDTVRRRTPEEYHHASWPFYVYTCDDDQVLARVNLLKDEFDWTGACKRRKCDIPPTVSLMDHIAYWPLYAMNGKRSTKSELSV